MEVIHRQRRMMERETASEEPREDMILSHFTGQLALLRYDRKWNQK